MLVEIILFRINKNVENKDVFEMGYWGNCCNTSYEELKQWVYAEYMDIRIGHPYKAYTNNKTILDMGGGPASFLLKCEDLISGVVVDPLPYPTWTRQRYAIKNIDVWQVRGEDLDTIHPEIKFDEVWMYNCLQHTDDPEKIIKNIKARTPIFRIFDWVDHPACEGHPQELKKEKLEEWIGCTGQVSKISKNGCYGKAFHGVFKLN